MRYLYENKENNWFKNDFNNIGNIIGLNECV